MFHMDAILLKPQWALKINLMALECHHVTMTLQNQNSNFPVYKPLRAKHKNSLS